MRKAQAFRLTLVMAAALTVFAGVNRAQALTEAQWEAARKVAQPMEKRLPALPGEFNSMSVQSAPGLPQTVPGGAGGKVAPAANVTTNEGIEPKNYGCLNDSCSGGTTNLNTVYHYNDSRIDPSVITHDPYRRTGYFLFTHNNTNFFYCTATLISRSILVLAAHCVYDTNTNHYIIAGRFYPACTNCNGGGTLSEPYGHADMDSRWATAGWINAASETAALDKGYDVAVVVLKKRSAPLSAVEMGSVVGWQGFCVVNCLQPYWQLSQLGYPSNYDGGNRMQYGEHIEKSDTRDYLLGSGMGGGSSGGPHVANIGVLADSAVDKGRYVSRNIVFAVTSWGYTNSSHKIQGASSLSGPGNTNGAGATGFKQLFNLACNRARTVHGTGSCTLLP